jgi:hypothetical protein
VKISLSLNLELPSVVSQSDFVILVICNHLNQNLRKIKRYLQTLASRVIITGALHGPQIKDIFRDFTLFKISDIETITTHIKISMASNIRESDYGLPLGKHDCTLTNVPLMVSVDVRVIAWTNPVC